MHLKRYKRETVQDALRAVREELGPTALVLSTRVVAASGVRGWLGRRMVEVTAAADGAAVSEDRQPAGEPSEEQRAVNAIAARLVAAGLDADLAREVAEAHPAHGRRGATVQSLRRTMAGQLASLAATDKTFAPVEVFIGPPGVGKTTTIAKIAAQERARNGQRLGLVAADGFRVGAVEQLRLYADILGSPLTVARSASELDAALEDARRPLLLDTAGRSPSDESSRDMLRLLAGRRDVRTHLVLAADTAPNTAKRVLDRFGDARPSRIVVTKLDEAEAFAPMLSVLRERKLPISYFGTGQSVPDDLQRATPEAIAAWAAGDGCKGVTA
jgi:flagellar biosynthesis protein FlhF